MGLRGFGVQDVRAKNPDARGVWVSGLPYLWCSRERKGTWAEWVPTYHWAYNTTHT